MNKNIYITDRFYDRLDELVSSDFIKKSDFNEINRVIEALGDMKAEELRSHVEALYAEDNAFIQQVTSRIRFFYLVKDQSFYLIDIKVRDYE